MLRRISTAALCLLLCGSVPLVAQDSQAMDAYTESKPDSTAKTADAQWANTAVPTREFSFPNVDIRSAFRALASAGEVDIVLSPTVTGRISVNLTQKTWQDAMRILCQMSNLQYSIEKEYIYVQTLTEYNATIKEADLIKEIIKIKHAKASDLEPAVKGLISPRGIITIVERSNALIISDISAKLEEIKKAIQYLDVETYQVHIQAQIVEVSANVTQELGVNWAYGGGQVTGNGVAGASLPAGSTVIPGNVGAPTSLSFGLLNGDFLATIQNLLSEGKGEVVARPQITTLDNKEANIFIGKRIPYNKLDKDRNSTVEFVEGGISLVVTPHITNDNRVILDLSPKKSDAEIDPISRGPIIKTQEARTTVVVNDGQTVVIGGLTSKDENEIETGVPILKDIPLLGALFRYTKTETRKNDLIIFVTPHIVRNDAVLGTMPAPSTTEPTSPSTEKPASWQ